MTIRNVFVYLVLILGAYLFQTVLYPLFILPELRIDLFLILVIHSSFSQGKSRTLVLALFLGLLMDVGLPLKGFFHPLIYLGVALLASPLWHNLNLHSRHYQAIFIGICAMLEGGAIWIILRLQGAELAEVPNMLQILVWRSLTSSLVGPFLLSALERLDQWLSTLMVLQESKQG
ncbi:MAG: hypothetical protein JSU72_08435 [Deltaproteobacteria bacterium]|nr:MAG: hypothetical protein JSU72_08435 [Deltaproteobacteria bacterium]